MKVWKLVAASFSLSVAVMVALGYGHSRTEEAGLKDAAGSISVSHLTAQSRIHAFTMLAISKKRQHIIGQATATSSSSAFQRWLYLGMVELERHMDPVVMHVLVTLTGQPPLVSAHYANFAR